MTNRIAIGIALLIVGFLAWDAYAGEWETTIYLGRRGLEFIEWLAFWR